MGDMKEIFQAHKGARQDARAEVAEFNRHHLGRAGIVFTEKSGTAIIRMPGFPPVDLYLTTTRWKKIETGKIDGGSIGWFIDWFRVTGRAQQAIDRVNEKAKA